ncbi:hypothetical protein LH47_02544 [Anoxybacillus thermarum]|uniref:Uncharacterized protein n=1 Tax=Anoxybacillus thermarum TaxID=404937 RepID=A0A0D0RVF1_9BACL|nr:hypothetical protein LH47_02544 [Anoxybacillus thermarum]
MSVLNKYVIIAHFHLMLRQNNFSEADLKEAVDLLHKELFPEVWAKINAKLEKEAAAATTAPKSVFIQPYLHVTPFADSQKISQELHRYITESKEDCTERQD